MVTAARHAQARDDDLAGRSATTRCTSRRSSAAGRTSRTSASTAGCSSATPRCTRVAFSVDHLGDVYLVGRLPLSAVEPDELDRVLGSVMTYSDEWFDPALEIGFRSSIEREWDWRVKRGESLANLAAFARFADPANRAPDAERRAAAGCES